MTAETYEQQTYRIAEIGELREHPQNPRQGDVGAIVTSIEANGFYGALVTQKSTGYVLAGNHRLKALVAQGEQRVPIIERDVDDQTALTILLSDNRTADLASYDETKLLALLQTAYAEGYLPATGYTGDDVDDLRLLWESDMRGLVDATQPDGTTAGRFVVSFDEQHRERMRAALQDAIEPLDFPVKLT